jgi:ribonuclease HI
MLCDNPHISTETVKTLNPAMCLFMLPVGPDHNCIKIMDEIFSGRPDLSDQLLDHPDVEYFTNGGSFVHQRERLAGYAVVTLHAVIETKRLPKETAAQKAELIALIRALQLAAGVQANIYTDSKYVLTTLPSHRALHKKKKKKGLINSEGKDIKYGQKILQLLKAVWVSKRVAVMHC